MVNQVQKIDIQTVRPGATANFDPVFEVTAIEGRAKAGGNYIHATLTPVRGGAQVFGVQTFRAPAAVNVGGPLDVLCRLVGQDPAQGFDAKAAIGRQIRLTLEAVEPETDGAQEVPAPAGAALPAPKMVPAQAPAKTPVKAK